MKVFYVGRSGSLVEIFRLACVSLFFESAQSTSADEYNLLPLYKNEDQNLAGWAGFYKRVPKEGSQLYKMMGHERDLELSIGDPGAPRQWVLSYKSNPVYISNKFPDSETPPDPASCTWTDITKPRATSTRFKRKSSKQVPRNGEPGPGIIRRASRKRSQIPRSRRSAPSKNPGSKPEMSDWTRDLYARVAQTDAALERLRKKALPEKHPGAARSVKQPGACDGSAVIQRSALGRRRRATQPRAPPKKSSASRFAKRKPTRPRATPALLKPRVSKHSVRPKSRGESNTLHPFWNAERISNRLEANTSLPKRLSYRDFRAAAVAPPNMSKPKARPSRRRRGGVGFRG